MSKALEHWQEVLDLEPLARDAAEMVARLLADLEGAQVAVARLRNIVARFPCNYQLRVLLIIWLRDANPTDWEASIRELLDIHPVDPWTNRELALALLRLGKADEAMAAAGLVMQVDPIDPGAHMIRGNILRDRGDGAGAKAAYREAIRLSVDAEAAIGSLVELCDTKDQRIVELQFICQELVRQVTFGDGLLTYRNYAARIIDPESVLATLRDALKARPDLWHAWSALVHQLVEMGQLDEALARAQEAAERFALLSRPWLDLAMIHHARNNRQEELEALRKAVEIDGKVGEPARVLADAHLNAGEFAEAKTVMEQAVARQPSDALNHGWLADALWRLGDREAAVAELRRAVRLDPGYEWAWNAVRQWSQQIETPELPTQLARELTETRPFEARSWLVLAEVLDQPKDRQQCAAALDRSLELNPRLTRAYDLRAFYLAEDGRFDEALTACRPDVFGNQLPWQLSARQAEVEANRGNVREAIALMRRIAADRPDLPWVWRRLADWLDATDDKDGYLLAARQMAKLEPKNAVAHGYLGDAWRRVNNSADAIQALLAAAALDPAYWFASANLVQLYLERHDREGAARALDRFGEKMPPRVLQALRIELAAANKDRDQAVEALRALCSCPTDELLPWRPMQAMIDRGWLKKVMRTVAEQLKHPDVAPVVAGLWVTLCSQRRQWRKCRRVLESLKDPDEAWIIGSQYYLIHLERHREIRLVRRYVLRHWERLKRDARTWGTVALALDHLRLYKLVRSFFANWQDLPSSTPSPFWSVVLALWESDCIEEANPISRKALELPHDDGTPHHRIYLAASAAMEGRFNESEALIHGIDPASLQPFYRAMHCLSHAMVQIDRELKERAELASYLAAKRRFRELLVPSRKVVQGQPTLCRLLHRCLARLAQDRGCPMVARWHRFLAWFERHCFVRLS